MQEEMKEPADVQEERKEEMKEPAEMQENEEEMKEEGEEETNKETGTTDTNNDEEEFEQIIGNEEVEDDGDIDIDDLEKEWS